MCKEFEEISSSVGYPDVELIFDTLKKFTESDFYFCIFREMQKNGLVFRGLHARFSGMTFSTLSMPNLMDNIINFVLDGFKIRKRELLIDNCRRIVRVENYLFYSDGTN